MTCHEGSPELRMEEPTWSIGDVLTWYELPVGHQMRVGRRVVVFHVWRPTEAYPWLYDVVTVGAGGSIRTAVSEDSLELIGTK